MTRSLPLVLLLVACGASGPAPSSPTDTPADCAAGGIPDDGDAEGCDFRVAGCCYSETAHACAAAGCAVERCTILESYPAQVACR